MLLVLKMEGGAMAQGHRLPLELGESKKIDSSLEPPEGTCLAGTLTVLSPVELVSEI